MADQQHPDAVDEQKALDVAQTGQSQLDKEAQVAAADFSKHGTGPHGEPVMDVLVNSPFRTYYEGPVFSVSAVNDTGPFDILPRHHNFITLLSPCEITLRTLEKGDQRIRISGGIMHVKADRVTVFLDV